MAFIFMAFMALAFMAFMALLWHLWHSLWHSEFRIYGFIAIHFYCFIFFEVVKHAVFKMNRNELI